MTGAEALREYVAGLIPDVPHTVSGMVDLLGRGNASAGRSQLAMLVAGTSDKHSKEYRNARRNIERYQVSEGHGARGGKQARANPVNINKAVGAAERELTKQSVARARDIDLFPTVKGDLDITGDGAYVGYRTAYPVGGDIAADALSDMWDEIADGDYEAAYAAFEPVLGRAYGLDDSRFQDIEALDLGLPDYDPGDFYDEGYGEE